MSRNINKIIKHLEPILDNELGRLAKSNETLIDTILKNKIQVEKYKLGSIWYGWEYGEIRYYFFLEEEIDDGNDFWGDFMREFIENLQDNNVYSVHQISTYFGTKPVPEDHDFYEKLIW